MIARYRDNKDWIDYRTIVPPIFDRTRLPKAPSDAMIEISQPERDALRELAVKCPYNPYLPTERYAFIRYAELGANNAFSSGTVSQMLNALDRGTGYVILAQLPEDYDLPPTPSGGGSLAPDYKGTHIAEFIVACLGVVLKAALFNFRQEGRGTAPLFDNVVPVRALREQKGAGGYANNFPFHCESTWHRFRPDYVCLLGLRGDPQAETLVTSILDLEADELQSTMPFNSYRIRPPDLYVEMRDQGIPYGTADFKSTDPIVRHSNGSLMNINFNGTECRGSYALSWLSDLESEVEAKAKSVTLDQGFAMILNNFRTCHTRTGYEPAFNAGARWFIRGNYSSSIFISEHGSLSPKVALLDKILFESLGWLDAGSNWTAEFTLLLEDPIRASKLQPDEREAFGQALEYLPIPGCRVV